MIPIVMAQDNDPIGSGFVVSLARPGGNITGLSSLVPEISAKQLELSKEIDPKLSRVTVLGKSTQPGNAQSLRELKLSAVAFGVKLQIIDGLESKNIAIAFLVARDGRADAVLVLGSAFFISYRTQIVVLAANSRIPTI
jgi:putative ABC transport system substrate-binding protein